MKKVIGIILAAFLVIGFGGPAAAAISQGNIILSAYSNINANGDTGINIAPGGYNVNIDLGSAFDFNTTSGSWDTGITLTDFGNSIDDGWNDVLVAGYAVWTNPPDPANPTEWYTYAYSTAINGEPELAGGFTSAKSAYQQIQVKAVSGTVYENADHEGYVYNMDGGTIPGRLSVWYENRDAEANLGTDTSIELYYGEAAPTDLGFFQSPNPVTDLAKIGIFTFSFDAADGSLLVDYSPDQVVPVPASVLLLGSGLLSLLGIRRKR